MFDFLTNRIIHGKKERNIKKSMNKEWENENE